MAQIWDQRPDESGPAYEAFKLFRDLGPSRTLVDAYAAHCRAKGGPRKPTPGQWKSWAKAYDWRMRASAWDAKNGKIEEAVRDKMVAAVVTDRMTAVLAQERKEQKVAGLLFDKAIEMLEISLTRRKITKTDDGRTITIQEPVKWNFGTVAKVLAVAHEIGRRSLNMPVRIDPKVTDEAPYFDSSGEMETATNPGQMPMMPADAAAKPTLGVSAVGPSGEGLIQPTKARPGNEPRH